MRILGFAADKYFSLAVRNYYAYDYTGFDMKPHEHPAAELMYIDGGGAEVTVFPDGKSARHGLRRGDFVLLAAGCPHKLFVPKGGSCRMLNLEFTPVSCETGLNFCKLLRASPILGCLEGDSPRFGHDTSGLALPVRQLIGELSAAGLRLENAYMVQSYILQTLILAARSLFLPKETTAFYVRKALQYVAQNFSLGIFPRDVAKHLGMSPVYLERQVKRHTGKTLLAHILYFRIDRAKKLMENTLLPLADIAAECGFNSRQSFYAAFTRTEGFSPRDYRKRRQASALSNRFQAPYEFDG